jgi:hypothetical protein
MVSAGSSTYRLLQSRGHFEACLGGDCACRLVQIYRNTSQRDWHRIGVHDLPQRDGCNGRASSAAPANSSVPQLGIKNRPHGDFGSTLVHHSGLIFIVHTICAAQTLLKMCLPNAYCSPSRSDTSDMHVSSEASNNRSINNDSRWFTRRRK